MKFPSALLIFILIVVVPLFAHLDSLPLKEWDESHLAGNAVEMKYNHNWIVTMNNDRPDMWQTKPPLMIWLQVISMNLLGINELAIRLPSALAGLGICLLLFFFFAKKYKEPLLALISVAVLVTSSGFTLDHAVRHGEYDALLTMLMTGYVLCYFLYLEEGDKKYIYSTFIMLILAALTKGIESLLFLPALLIYTIYKKKFFAIFKQKELYIGIAGFLFFIVGYYMLREHYSPGYIFTVWQNELGGRYGSSIEGHDSYPLIYFDWLRTQFGFWYLWVLPGILVGVFSDKKWLKDFTIYTTLVIATYFLILSSAKTALSWYSLPAYPFLAVFAAIFIYTIFRALADTSIAKKISPYSILPIAFILVIFFIPYTTIKDTVLAPRKALADTEYAGNMELLMQDVLHNTQNIDGYIIADLRHDQHLGWYYKVFGYQHRPIAQKDQEELAPNSLVLAFRPESKKFIESHFSTHVIQTYYNSVTAYKLLDKK